MNARTLANPAGDDPASELRQALVAARFLAEASQAYLRETEGCAIEREEVLCAFATLEQHACRALVLLAPALSFSPDNTPQGGVQ